MSYLVYFGMRKTVVVRFIRGSLLVSYVVV